MNKIIIIGPECSGKTTLANDLSNALNLPVIAEYARDYISEIKYKYQQSDLIKIAKEQWRKEKSINQSLTIFDTDLITLKIWSEFKYKKCDPWIINKINEQKDESRLYLLCNPDIKWEFDPQRENQFDRDKIFQIYKCELQTLNHDYFIIKDQDRLVQAKKIIKNFID